MNTIKNNARNHSIGFVGGKEAHAAFKRMENRVKRQASNDKQKAISIDRKRRGRGYADPGYFDANIECEVHGNITAIRHTSIPLLNNRGTQLLSCNDAPLYWTATGRGISMPRGEAEYDWVIYGYDVNLSSREGKELHEHYSQGWE
jgi:hypothetical protein